MNEAAAHEVIIEPSRGWPAPRWRELWEYRDLLRVLIERDFRTRYRQTLLGPLWFIIQPLLTTAMFTLVFGKMAGLPTDGVPPPLFYFCGLLGWSYFSQTINAGSQTFIANSHLFSKVYFPRLIMPAAGIVSNLFATALQLIPLALLYLYFGSNPSAGDFHLGWPALVLPPLAMLQLAVLGLGVSLWMSAGTAKYRDLAHFNQFLVQLWMFGTPIFYPMSHIPARWQTLFSLNPVAAPVEMLRLGFLGRGFVSWPNVALSVGLTLALLFSGLILFQRAERTAVDAA